MSLKTRLMPRGEWDVLRSVPTLAESVSYLPAETVVVALEDHGQLVGVAPLVPVWMAEGPWIRVDYRGGMGFSLLAKSIRETAKAKGLHGIFMTSHTDEIRDLIARLGAVEPDLRLHQWVI
jgi:hypothetical protein